MAPGKPFPHLNGGWLDAREEDTSDRSGVAPRALDRCAANVRARGMENPAVVAQRHKKISNVSCYTGETIPMGPCERTFPLADLCRYPATPPGSHVTPPPSKCGQMIVANITWPETDGTVENGGGEEQGEVKRIPHVFP